MNNTAIPNELPTYIDPNINLAKVKKDCQKMVRSRARVSAGVALVPIPFFDVAVDAGLLSLLLPEITAKFGLIENANDTSKLASKEDRLLDMKDRAVNFASMMAVRGVVKQTVQGFGGRILAKQVTKYIPLGGQIVAASLGYIIFKKVADAHINECYELAQSIQQRSTN